MMTEEAALFVRRNAHRNGEVTIELEQSCGEVNARLESAFRTRRVFLRVDSRVLQELLALKGSLEQGIREFEETRKIPLASLFHGE